MGFMNFARQQLEAFAAVIEFQHFGRAATALNITRGAVSQRIKALEEAFGTPLLVRDGGVPTPAGEVLIRHIQMLRSLEADTLQQLKPTDSTWASTCRCGTSACAWRPKPAIANPAIPGFLCF
jgi:LysR family transcriptional regulator (chromosome initiation inhibitor)